MGKTVQSYELLDQLGQGGMGVVYKARHIHFDEIVAIKKLWEQFSNDKTVLNLFMNEAKILRRLNHKNIVQVSDIFNFESENYIVMEYVQGRTLDEIIRHEVGPIRRERAVHLFRQMLEGVAYIHSQPNPIIHRDIKPLNILVNDDDTVKITDFGIAKALDVGHHASTVVKGTPVYMSPEAIIDPSTIDIRTDVYSLGMTFYEMLCAKTPFSGNSPTTPTAVYAKIMNGEVPPPTHFYPGISEELSSFVMKAIHKNRDRRFNDAQEMLRELESLERGGFTVYGEEYEQSDWDLAVDEIPESKSFHVRKPSKSAVDDLDVEMVFVEGGIFIMGNNRGDDDEKPEHEVELDGFFIAKYPVMQVLWEEIMGENPSYFESPYAPVEQVSWYDAIEFCNKLSRRTGLEEVYEISMQAVDPNNLNIHDEVKWIVKPNFKANGYRLPTEAEWEFAARGGNKSQDFRFSGSNLLQNVGWFAKNSREATVPVMSKQPNELGIFDMSGNVWEWCWDWYDKFNYRFQQDPRGPESGEYKITRGGSWSDEEKFCRTNYRDYDDADRSDYNLGFRLARTK